MYDLRQFKPALYALVLLGISGFAIAAATPILWAFSVALILLNIAWVTGGRFKPIPRYLANMLVLVAAAYVGFRITGEGTPVLIVGQFLVALQLIKLYEQRANRDFGQLLVLSLLLMVAAAISTGSLLFGILMIGYLFLSLYCCLLFHLKVETDAARLSMGLSEQDPGNRRRLRQDQRRLTSSMRRLTMVVSAVAVAFAVITFLVVPRGTGANIVGRNRAQFRVSEAVTGFSSQVSFQDIARITQNETPVAYLEVLRNGQPMTGGEPLYLRGNTLDVYVSDPGAIDRWTWRKSSEENVVMLGADRFGITNRLGPPIRIPPVIVEQRFEVEPVGLDVLPSLAGAFLLTTPPQAVRHNLADGTISSSVPIRRQMRYRVWSTGALRDPLTTSGLPGSDRQGLLGDLARLKSLYDRTEMMRLATQESQRVGDTSTEALVREQHRRYGLLVPSGDLLVFPGDPLDVERGPIAKAVDRQLARARQYPAYPPPPEIMRFALDPAVSGVSADGQSLGRQRVARQGPTELDEQIARNIARYLQTQYTYTLDVTDARLSTSQDPLAWFVSEDGRRGHCEFFAGTAALACQALGIPARVVVGFRCDDFNGSMGKYVVRQSHAHAWVEVLTQRGWIMLDPTSGNGDDLLRDQKNFLDTIQHWFEFMQYTWANSIVAYDNNARSSLISELETDLAGGARNTLGLWDRFTEWLERQNLYFVSAQVVAWLIALMSAAAALTMGWFFYERWRLRRRAQRIGLRGLASDDTRRLARQLAFFEELVLLLERHGHARRPHQTPREFARSLAFLPRQAFDTVWGMTDVFYRVRYGQGFLTPRRQRHLTRSLDVLAQMLSKP